MILSTTFFAIFTPIVVHIFKTKLNQIDGRIAQNWKVYYAHLTAAKSFKDHLQKSTQRSNFAKGRLIHLKKLDRQKRKLYLLLFTIGIMGGVSLLFAL